MRHLELLATREIGVNGMAVCLKPRIPVVITPGLVEEIRVLQNSLAEKYLTGALDGCFYVVWFLENRKELCYRGLDFNFIFNCLKNHKDAELDRYIDGVFNLIFLNRIGLGFPVINCSIVSRTLTSLSKEFFFLNKICFIQNSETKGIQKISLFDEYDKLLLKKEIYQKSHYFYFDFVRVEKMRGIIETIDYEVPTVEEINSIKDNFENIKQETIEGIYALATKNIKILERMAHFDTTLCMAKA